MIFCALYAVKVNDVSSLMKKAREAGLKWKFQYILDGKDYGLLVGPEREPLVKFLVEALGFSHENAEKEVR